MNLRSRGALVDALEPRRVLASYSGTNLDDTIVIYAEGSQLHVVVNGVDNITGDVSVFVHAQFGNDIVRLFSSPANMQVSIHLDGGDDTFTTYNPALNGGSLDEIRGVTFVGGEDGNDRLVMDDTLGHSNPYAFEEFGAGIQRFGFDEEGLSYREIENFELNQDTSSPTVSTHLTDKPESTSVTIFGGPNSDHFVLGGGNLEAHGWSVATTTVFGGGGSNDSITFNDIGGLAAQPLTVAGTTLSRGIWGCTYSAIERQTITGTGLSDNVLNINAHSGSITSTTIEFSNGTVNLNAIDQTTTVRRSPRRVNVGNGSLPTNGAVVTLDLASIVGEIVTVNDHVGTGNDSYTLSATQLIKTAGATVQTTINYTGLEHLTLNANQGNNRIDVDATPVDVALNVNANAGDDIITIGGGDFDNLLSPVTVAGNVGDDIIRFQAATDPDLFTATLRNNGFVTGGLTHSYASCEMVDIRSGPGGSNLLIQSVPQLTLPAISLTNFTGGSGPDTVTLGTGNVGVSGNVSVSGGSGGDTLVLDDSNGTSAASYTFDQGNRFFKGSGVVTVLRSGFEQTILDANNGNNTVTVDRTISALTVLANGGNDTINVLDGTAAVTVNSGGETTSMSAPFGDSIAVNTDFAVPGDTAATVLIDQSDAVLGLTVAQQGTLRVVGGAVLAKTTGTGSTFALTGAIDLAGGALISRAGGPTPAQFRTQIIAGRNGGAWNGSSPSGAINSSLAAGSSIGDGLGYGSGSEIGVVSIGGFSIAAGDTLLRYALEGDGNLNGPVNLADFNRLAANFGQSNRAWVDGDSNYDGLVNLADFNALAGNFGQAIAAPDLFGGKPTSGIHDSADRREILDQLT